MRKRTLLVGVAMSALILGMAGPVTAATPTYATSETGGDQTNIGATGPPDWDYALAATPEGLYTQLNTPDPGTWMTASFAVGSLCLADAGIDLVVFEAGTSDPLKVTVNGIEATMVGSEAPYSVGSPPDPDGTYRSYDVSDVGGPFTTVRIDAIRPDPQRYAEIDAVQCVNTVPALIGLSPVHAWVGLKNSDDQGTRFDLRAELLDQSGNVVATGLERCVNGVTRNPSLAKEVIVNWTSFPAIPAGSAEEFDLRLSTRIGTNLDDTKCVPGPGSSHNNAVGLRVYYDSTARLSRFDTTIGSSVDTNQYLHSNGNPCANAPSVGATNLYFDENLPAATTVAAAKCKDSLAVNFAGGNPFKVIGTWNGETAPSDT